MTHKYKVYYLHSKEFLFYFSHPDLHPNASDFIGAHVPIVLISLLPFVLVVLFVIHVIHVLNILCLLSDGCVCEAYYLVAAHPPQVKLSYLVVIWHDHSHRKEICLFGSRLGLLVLRMLRGRPHEKFTLAFAGVRLERNKLLGL